MDDYGILYVKTSVVTNHQMQRLPSLVINFLQPNENVDSLSKKVHKAIKGIIGYTSYLVDNEGVLNHNMSVVTNHQMQRCRAVSNAQHGRALCPRSS